MTSGHASGTPAPDELDRLLATLDARGVRLSIEGDRLRCDAPRGTLTPELQHALTAFKDRILQRLARLSGPIPRRERNGGGLPLSPAQYRLWLLDRIEGGTPRYNLVSAVRLDGPLDENAVGIAVQALVRRHEILRSRFVAVGDDVLQIPLDDCPVGVVPEDLEDVTRDEEDAAIGRVFRDESRVVFDLANPPLVRVRLLRFAPDRHALVLNQHHIVTDVLSLDVFARDFSRLYAEHAGTPAPPPLAALPLQYADYAAWQQEHAGGENLQRGLAFWTHELSGLPERLALPTDFTRPATLTYRGGAVPVHVPPPLVAALQRFGRESGASLFMVMYTALCVVLARTTGSRDFAVGVPVTNRPRPELEELLGFFINSLVLRCRIEPQTSFRELLATNRDAVLAAFAHQDTPFEKLVEALKVRRDLSYSPLFQVMFSFMSRTRESTAGAAALAAVPLAIPQQHALFELDWQVRETAGGVVGFLIYAADLFDAKTAERLVSRFVSVLERACAAPDTATGAIDVLAPGEREEMLEDWNATAAEYPADRCVHDLFDEQARRTPDALAVTFAGTSWTYRRLEAESARIAAALARIGVKPGTRVGLCVERNHAMVAALLGILKAGAAYIPLDPGFPADRLAFMVEDAGVVLTLSDAHVDAALRARLSAFAPVVLLDDLFATATAIAVTTTLASDAAMYAIYTSGSTGRPKGVVIPHRAVVNFLWSMRRQPGITTTDALLAVTTLSFDIAVLELFLPLVSGARVVLAAREDTTDPQRLMRLLETESITLMQATPATWRMLLAANWHGDSHLTILCGGEALTRELSRALVVRGRALWNMYGPTETTVWSAVRRIVASDDERDAAGIEPLGRPIANTRIYIVTADLDAAPIGAAGELCIGGDGLARAYLHQPGLTAERFVPDPFRSSPGARMYRTGDSARFRPDGTIEFLGRLDAQVKLRGFRIELGEIEFVLGNHPAIAQSTVVMREDVPGDPRLVAYYVAAGAATDVPLAALREHLRRALPDYMVPAAYVRLERIPLTPNGKVDRRALPPPESAERPEAEVSGDRPSELEAAIAGLWEDVLGVRPPGLDANFFDLGGHSLLIIRLHQRLTAEVGAQCDVLDLFRHPTIRQQAALAAGNRTQRDVRADAGVHAKRQHQALARQRALAAARPRQ